MKPMTIKEIAELATSGETTIRRWAEKASAKMANISAKMAKAKETSIAATFDLDEVIAIVRAGGNDTLADLLLDNARKTAVTEASQVSQAKKNVGLPNGRQLAELRMLYPKEQLTARIDAIMGWAPVPDALVESVVPTPRSQLQIADRYPVRVEKALRGMMPETDNGRRTVYTVAKKQLAAEEAKRTQERMNGKLFGDEARA